MRILWIVLLSPFYAFFYITKPGYYMFLLSLALIAILYFAGPFSWAPQPRTTIAVFVAGVVVAFFEAMGETNHEHE
jgi:hypothetical protein